MNYNVKPKLDGAGSTLPRAFVSAAPTNSAEPAEEDIFIEIGPPGTTSAGMSTVSGCGLALYTFKNSPSIPGQIKETCIGHCSGDIYAKWPGGAEWEKLADCGGLDSNGKHIIEVKIYEGCSQGIAPVIEEGDYNAVYFRNVAMTHVATEDYDNGRYPSNVTSPSKACIAENNGKMWAVLRLAGSSCSQVPTFHLLVREVQKILSLPGCSIPSTGGVIVGSFIGSSSPDGDGIYKNYTCIADEMVNCTLFVCGSSAATILDFIRYDKSNIYGLGKGSGTRISQNSSGYGVETEFVASVTADDNNDYYPVIPNMMQNPWPNQQKTCESGFFISFTGYGTISLGMGKAAIDLAYAGDKCEHLCQFKTFFASDVTINDLNDEVINAYNPASSGGLWARYFCGSAGIWGEVKAKSLMHGQDEDLKDWVIPSIGMDMRPARVGVYVDDSGNIVAVRSGTVTGHEKDVQVGHAYWNDLIKSKTHEDWIDEGGSGTPEHTYYASGTKDPPHCVIYGYEGSSVQVCTELMGCYVGYTRWMQFGEVGEAYGEGNCGLPAITTIKTIFICTGSLGFTVEDVAKCHLDTVILNEGDRPVTTGGLPLPANVSICTNMTTDTQLAVTLNLDGIFERKDDTYTPGQSASFSIPIKIGQDKQDEIDGIYYPDPSKKGTQIRWIPFQTTTAKLGFIGS